MGSFDLSNSSFLSEESRLFVKDIVWARGEYTRL